ncbi:MAG: bifunctional oligoribonuclease/PAP phosphatase NrnA [Candidatus Omnitrophica bacterium]|nr:bifunctional oligoribonuclease/PAP phosphatase NrnA [Candidatus Omnitrophota bacterium]MBU1871455.1 bifunctional oligoribonuclease/PAP phosphatase NrnA [Candidatus Omnitrophota bacterium]
MSIQKVIDCINRNKKFLITSHQNLEGDALGSEIAFYRLLKKKGKSALIVNQDPTSEEYTFLKDTKAISRYRPKMKVDFDVLVLLDCSDKSRPGKVYDLVSPGKTVLNIDHHISNTKFGEVNWVLSDASSVAEMVYRLYKAMRVKIDLDSARALYTGILTDTGSFRYINTSSFTHQMAAELMKHKLDILEIYRNIYESVSYSDMFLLSKIFSRLEKDASGKIIIFQIRINFLRQKKVSFDLTENILNFGRLIRGCQACVLFREQVSKPGQIRVNFRSQGKVDVNRIAKFFGGGGHKTASGCTIIGSLKQARKMVVSKIKEQLK